MRKKSDLRAAQVRTVTRLYEHDETQAVLPMGGGKTAAALTAFVEMKRDGIASEMFVMAPKRVAALVWPAEVKLWEHLQHLKIVHVHGAEHKRHRHRSRPVARRVDQGTAAGALLARRALHRRAVALQEPAR
jgi:superfamily II DNA or RNA helicase